MSVETEAVPSVTDHAKQRWFDRADGAIILPDAAWQHAQRIDATGAFHNVDELRYHGATRTLILRTGGRISTVYSIDNLRDDVYHAVKHALPEDIHE